MNEWLRAHGMPPITVVEKMDRNGNRLTLETECLRSGTLPSIAYGFKRCSQKHKVGSVTTTRCAALCGRPGTGSHGLSATMPGSGNGMSIPENSMKRTKNMRTATR